MNVFLNMSMFLFVPLILFCIFTKYEIVHIGRKSKIFVGLLYIVILNICVFSISYVRGVRELNFDGMTMTYRLKYMGLEFILGITFLTMMRFHHSRNEMTSIEKQGRHSSFELLRIIAAGLIILFHYVYGKWDYSYMGKYKVTIDIIWMFGEIGVNVFALLSGYFMIEQKKPFRAKKAFLMWMQVLFYSILTNIISPIIIGRGGYMA